ncbi:hypothetical protein BU17DRAFT_82100 [Hysterangium stoloniferum]|nr:hypothetical protein BU17DRAFT_82100 [Hysterangium stoloniferum]
MHVPLVSFSLLCFITQVTAQFEFPSPAIEYDAPPLETGVLGVTAFFTLTTLIQLIIVSTYLFRGRSPHILPAVVVLLGMLFMIVSNVLFILQLLTFYVSFDPLLPDKLNPRFHAGEALFYDWADPLIFVAVALIVRDRYRTHTQKANSDKTLTKPLPIELFMIPFYVFAAFIVIFSSSFTRVFQTLPTFDAGLSEAQYEAQLAKYEARLNIGNDLVYTSDAISFFATLLLVPLVALVRSRIGRDELMNWTSFAIIPSLCFRIIPSIVITVMDTNTKLDTFTSEQLDLANIITNLVFYFIVFCFFCHIFVWTRLWYGPGEQSNNSNNSYGYIGGQMPLAQFPGQWGYPQGGTYMYVQTTPGMQYPPAQGQFQGVHGQVQQYPLPQDNGQNPSSGQVTQHPLPQTQQVSGPEKALPAQPTQ